MQRPKSIKAGVRLLLAADVVLGIIIYLLHVPMLFATAVIGFDLYFIYFCWRGKLWARISLLVMMVVAGLRGGYLNMMFQGEIIAPFWPIAMLALRIGGVAYLFKKESSLWYSELAMQEMQKRNDSQNLIDRFK